MAKELGVSRRLLYTWREKLEPTVSGASPPANAREATLRKEVHQLKRVLAPECAGSRFFQRGLAHPSRRDASGTDQLARRHLRTHPGRDVRGGVRTKKT